MAGPRADWLDVGQVAGHYGLQGWLKILSWTDPRDQIFKYHPLIIGEETVEEFETRTHGKGLLLRVAGFEDRTESDRFIGLPVRIDRSQLPEAAPGEYYWSDLEDCRVVNETGHVFGVVERILETGANDVLVVRGEVETLIPFVMTRYVKSVDIAQKLIVVDWEPDYL